MTDVNIATELLADAFIGAYDTAIIISGDSDMTPPILAVHKHFPNKRIVVAFPPKRNSVQLANAAHAKFRIGRAKFRDSQLPNKIVLSSNTTLERPKSWA